MKAEKKVIEIETVTFDEKDIAVVEEAFDIISNLVGKIQDEMSYNDYEPTKEENKILEFAERIHREFLTYEDTYENCF